MLLLAAFLAAPAVSAQGSVRQMGPAHEYDHVPRGRIAIINSTLTGSFALLRAAVDGRIRSFSDATSVFAVGAVGGYGFYAAKELVGGGDIAAGLGVAYLSQSVVRNTARGMHPLASLCAGPGPADVCVDTGLEPGLAAGVRMEVNAVSAAASLVLPVLGMKPTLGGGHLIFTTDRHLGDRDNFVRAGFTIGRSAVVNTEAEEITRRHEMIHVLQAIQVGAVTPYLTLSQMRGRRTYARLGRLAFEWDIQLDWLYFALAGASAAFPYEEQWTEVEAYRLTAPPVSSGGPILL